MDINTKLKYYEKILKSNTYVRYVIDVINNGSEFTFQHPDEKQLYYDHLPFQLELFFQECITLVSDETAKKLDFNYVNKDYLLSFIYAGLDMEDMINENESIPMQASIFFLVLELSQTINVLSQDEFSFLFNKILCCFNERIQQKSYLSLSVILHIKRFLSVTNRNLQKFTSTLIFALAENVEKHTRKLNLDSECIANVDHGVYSCFMLLVEKFDFDDLKEKIVIPILIKLSTFFTIEDSNAISNASNFLLRFIKKMSSKPWYCGILISLFDVFPQKAVQPVLSQIDVENYSKMLTLIINRYVRASEHDAIINNLDILAIIIDNLHGGLSDVNREAFIKRIITEMFYRISHNIKIVEKIMFIYIKLFKKKDIQIRRTLQRIMSNDKDNVSGKVLFKILCSKCDLLWKYSSYNIKFIELTCLMFSANRNFISSQPIKVIETLCSKATGLYIRQCIPLFMQLIKKYIYENGHLVKSLLAITTSFALKSGAICDYYIKELFNLIAPIFNKNLDSDVEFAICNLLLADDFDCVNLFKGMEFLKLIKTEDVEVLIEEKILKAPTAWKLLVVLLDLIEYHHLPEHLKFYYLKFVSIEFYDTDESLYVIQVIMKLFSYKHKYNSISDQDVQLASTLEESLKKYVLQYMIPKRHINDVVMLLLTLAKVTKHSTDWMREMFTTCKNFVFSHISNLTCNAPINRVLFYMGVIVTHVTLEFSENDVAAINNLLSEEFQNKINNDNLWSSLIYFYGKFVLKSPEIKNSHIIKLKYALEHGVPLVKQTSMAVVYDICNLRLSYFDILDSTLIETCQSDNVEICNGSLQILMKLINEDNIKLTKNDFIKVFSVLFLRNIKISFFYRDVLEQQFIQRNESLIVKYFIHFVMYINNCQDHILFQFDCKSNVEYTHAKKILIYKMTYCNMQRMNQLQILNVIVKDILESIYSGKMPLTKNTYSVFNDILLLIIFTAMQYTNEIVDDVVEFHNSLLVSIKNDFFTSKRYAEMPELQFLNVVGDLMTVLLKVLYKIERSNKDIIPHLFMVIAFCTRTFYDQLKYLVQNSKKLRNLYYEFPNFYNKHQLLIDFNLTNIIKNLNYEEWCTYLNAGY